MGDVLLNAYMIIKSTCKLMDFCCNTFRISVSLIEEVGKTSLSKDRSHNVEDTLSDTEFNFFQPAMKTIFSANQYV